MGAETERPEEPETRLARAIDLLASGRIVEALREANAAATLDPSLRARALIVARVCVRKELDDPPKRAGTVVVSDLLTGRHR